MKSRALRFILILSLLCIETGCGYLYRKIGGDFVGEPEEMEAALTPLAKSLIDKAFAGLDPNRLVDVHLHLIGNGKTGSGVEVNPTWMSLWHPLRRARTYVYMSASGVSDPEQADRLYVERLVRLTNAFPAGTRFFLYAMDRHYLPNGEIDPVATTYYVPNDYLWTVYQRHPKLFVPVPSIHPYRKDALEELERWAGRGCRFLKWLPNSHGMDPLDPKLIPFYKRMKELRVTLLTHTGDEQAIDADNHQHLGNPLRLRLPLEHGVKVVALHCATHGEHKDLDDPEAPGLPSFELLLRIMDNPKYKGLLFGGLAATTFYHHVGDPLDAMLARDDLHERFINGSDYPVPGVNVVTQPSGLADLGYISEEEADALNEIYGYNPLLFDFVVKRTVRHPKTGQRFRDEAFLLPESMEP